MKICYCLTTNGADVHAAMTLVSVRTVRRAHPGARIVVVCDEESLERLGARRHPLLGTAGAEFLAAKAPGNTPSLRNRHVKTRLRQLVDGDFLYLDGDTLVRGPLDEIFATPESFAAAANHNSSGAVEPAFAHELEAFRSNGWLPPTVYVNGGVLFFRDTPEAHRFGRLWHGKWLESSLRGAHFDQPALNSALQDSGVPCRMLEDRFNAQVQVRPHTARGAHLWHIYASMPTQLSPRTVLDEAVETLMSGGTLDDARLASLSGRSHPWICRSPIDSLAVRRMMAREGFLDVDALERLWLVGNRQTVVRRLLGRLRNGLRRSRS